MVATKAAARPLTGERIPAALLYKAKRSVFSCVLPYIVINLLTAAPVEDPVTPEAVALPVALPEAAVAADIIPLEMADAPVPAAPAAAPATPATPAAAPAAAAAPAPAAPVAAALFVYLLARLKCGKRRKIFSPCGTGDSCLEGDGSSV